MALGVPRQPPDQVDYENVIEQAYQVLGDINADKEFAGAQALKWSDVLTEALSV